jgi:cyclopropane-fatty-acyl-phospholipid synthase
MLFARLCKALVHDGALTLIDADGTTYRLGRAGRAPDLVLRLHDRSLGHKLALAPCFHLGEAYVDGTLTLERGDVYDLFDLYARNLERLEALPEAGFRERVLAGAQRVGERVDAFFLRRERAAGRGDPADVHDHFLDGERQRSCAYFADPQATLEAAEEAGKQHLAAKLLLRPGQRVLDVGSGSGGLSLHLAVAGGVDVIGITLSAQELAVAKRRAAEAGLAGCVSFHRRDLRHETGRYDRVVSLGMPEHVDPSGYGGFFARLREVLAGDGVAVVQCIARIGASRAGAPWLRAPLFATARAPALSELLPAIERARLWVTDVEILRLHYADTLRHWRRRLVSDWERLSQRHDDRFCRRWELALALAETGFRRGGLVILEIQLAKRADAVPLTREYVYERTRASLGTTGIAA